MLLDFLSPRWLPVPWEEFVESVDVVVVDPGEHVGEVGFQIEV